MIKESVVVKADPGLMDVQSHFLYRKQASMQVQCIFRLEKSISMRKVLWDDESEPDRW